MKLIFKDPLEGILSIIHLIVLQIKFILYIIVDRHWNKMLRRKNGVITSTAAATFALSAVLILVQLGVRRNYKRSIKI